MATIFYLAEHKWSETFAICELCDKNGKDCADNADICLPLEILRQLVTDFNVDKLDNARSYFE